MKAPLRSALFALALFAAGGAGAAPARSGRFVAQGYAGASALDDFPVLVRLSPARVQGFDYADCEGGAGISFALEDGTVLPHEIDTWDPSGESLVWVKLPTLAGAGTAFYVRWADADPPANDPAAVWSRYAVVVHGGAGVTNAVGGVAAAAGSPDVSTTADSGRIGGGIAKSVSNAKGVNVENPSARLANGSQFTVSAWFKRDGNGGNGGNGTHILAASRPAWSGSVGFLLLQEKGKYLSVAANGAHFWSSGKTLADRTWGHVAFAYDGTSKTVELYLDGEKINTKTNPWPLADDSHEYWTFGSYMDAASADSFVGDMDELRVFDGAASADRIAAEWDTVANETFLSYPDGSNPVSIGIAAGAPTAMARKPADLPLLVWAAEGAQVAVSVDWGDGATSTTNLVGTGAEIAFPLGHVYRTTGEFAATATAEIAAAGVVKTATATIVVSGILYVDAAGGSDDNDGLDPASAKSTIAGAVAALTTRVPEIRVLDGTHALTNALALSSAVAIRGNDADPSRVVLTAASPSWTPFALSDAAATLSGLTFADMENVTADSILSISAGTVTNCVFRNLSAPEGNRDLILPTATADDILVCRSRIEGCSFRSLFYAYGQNEKPRLEDCEIVGNTTRGQVAAKGTVRRCKIVRNRCSKEPIYLSNAHDCLFVENSGGECSTIRDGNSWGCTFVGNVGDKVLWGKTHRNGLFFANTNATGASATYSGSPKLMNSLVPRTDINLNVESAGLVVSTEPRLLPDFSLGAGSPALNAGDAALTSSATDLAGNPRVALGEVDLGCYEKQTLDEADLALVVPAFAAGTATVVVGAPATAVFRLTAPAGAEATVHVDWGDGTSSERVVAGTGAPLALSFDHAYATAGSYDVAAAAALPSGTSVSRALPGRFHVTLASAAVLYVDAAGGSDDNDGLTLESAKRTVVSAAAALDGLDGSTIRVLPGTHELNAEIFVTNALTIEGWDAEAKRHAGRESVVVTNVAAGARLLTLDNPAAVVRNLTLAGGRCSGNGGAVSISSGLLSNCLVCNSDCTGSGKGVYMANTTNAVVADCLVTGNSNKFLGSRGGTAGINCAGTNAQIFRTRIVDNRWFPNWNNGGCVFGGTLYDCELGDLPTSGACDRGAAAYGSVLYRCRVRGVGGYMSLLQDCTLYDCIVEGNTCRQNNGHALVINSKLYNCTVVDNVGPVGLNASCTAFNSIVWGNTNQAGEDANWGDGATVAYSCTAPLPATGDGNISAEPKFDARKSAKPFTLLADSPGFGAGSTDETHFPAAALRQVDLYGTKRVVRLALEMGAVETPAPPATSLILR